MVGQKRRPVRITLVQHAKPARDAVRIELNIPSWADVREPLQLAFLAQTSLHAVRDVREKAVVVVVRDDPLQNDSPGLLWRARKTQAFERHRHHGYVTLGRHFAPGI